MGYNEISCKPYIMSCSGLFNSSAPPAPFYLSFIFATVPKLPTLSAPPSSTVVSMSTWLTAHPRPPFPPPTPRSRRWRTSARARCLTWLTTKPLWTTPARTLAQRRARISSATARTPSTTAPPGSSWWEGWCPGSGVPSSLCTQAGTEIWGRCWLDWVQLNCTVKSKLNKKERREEGKNKKTKKHTDWWTSVQGRDIKGTVCPNNQKYYFPFDLLFWFNWFCCLTSYPCHTVAKRRKYFWVWGGLSLKVATCQV